MTPNLELLKKIQPLFTEWNVGDRGINKGGTFIYIEEENSLPKLPSDGHRIIFIDKHCTTIIPYSQWRNALHYPYPHQIIDALGERFYYLNFNPIGKWWTVKLWDKDKNTIAYNESDTDRETTLLKALVWQMENK